MDLNVNINELRTNMSVGGFYLLQTVALKTAKNGKPYLDGVLQDATGTISFKSWNYHGTISQNDAGNVAYVEGSTSEYNGAVQYTADTICIPDSVSDSDKSRLIPMAPIDKASYTSYITDRLSSIKDPDYKSICLKIWNDCMFEYVDAPAAKSIHHAFIHGLLMHSGNMMRAADMLCGLYDPDGKFIDRDIVVAGAFLHDIGKLKEYALSGTGLASDYSLDGKLLGHPGLGLIRIASACEYLDIPKEKALILEHLIASHHERLEHGAITSPSIIEAELLCHLDMLDARLEIYREELSKLNPGEMSSNLYFLGHGIYRHF